jgi:NAD(P)-dependent dehydrogenase (short-subunit alcohol dehydrogenase family)
MYDFSGKLALVTGASRGIGAAVAKALAASGAQVILLARTQGALEEVDDAIRAKSGQATLIPLDLFKLDDINKLGPAIHEKFGGLDILVGNAGMLGPMTPAHQVAGKDWDRTMKLNFSANVRLVHTLDPLLRASSAGRIVFTTSGLAEAYLPFFGPYAASKAALNAFAKTYAVETQQTKLKINLVSPGMVATKMLEEAFPGGIPAGTKGPDAVVETYLKLASPSYQKSGEIISLD